jgi:hypothetical protein
VKRGCRIKHNEEIHNLYTSPNDIEVIKLRMMRLARNVMKRVQNFVGKHEGKRPLVKNKSIWGENGQ